MPEQTQSLCGSNDICVWICFLSLRADGVCLGESGEMSCGLGTQEFGDRSRYQSGEGGIYKD